MYLQSLNKMRKLNKTTFIEEAKKDWKDLLNVVIGDDKQSDFKPQFKIERWDNEANVSIRLITDETFKPKTGERLRGEGNKQDCDFYPIKPCKELKEGGYEFEVILKEKPNTNQVRFTLVDKDVEYYYQPELTQKEKDEGAERPEHVIGSYAVYTKTPKTNWKGGKEYKCGKVGHIYRPKIHDSNGKEVWGEMNISNGILTITVPQEFLDRAVYPVVVDPTFGYTSRGNSSDQITLGSGDYSSNRFGYTVSFSESGTLEKLSVAFSGAGFSGANIDATAFINNEDSEATDSHGQVAKIERVNIADISTWGTVFEDFTASGEALTPNEYILNAVAKWNSGPDVSIQYDSDVTRNNYFSSGGVYATLRDENPWDEVKSTGARRYSFYATYEAEPPRRRIRLRGGVRLLGNIRLR